MSTGNHTQVGEEPEMPLGNLPVQITPLLGRAAALEELSPLLWRTRLLTLCGPGGAGKSRLAAALAEAVREDFTGGAWWADLSASVDGDLVGQAVAAAVVPGAQVGDPPAAIARQFVASSLLVLDNCEQVLAGCAQLVADLLARAPALRIIVTSRQSVGIPGEQVWRTPGLCVSDCVEGSVDGDAVTLFLQRAQQTTGAFSAVASGTRKTIAEICGWLDGIPLAIELAAARVAVLSVSQIAERLKRDTDLLRQTTRAAAGRQRTLRDTLEWSHQLLEPDEQRLFRRLGAFRGSFSLAAVETICSDEQLPEAEILDLLSRLIDQSLVHVVESSTTPRYRLLSTVRQYAQGKLDAGAELETTRRHHAGFYLRLGQAARVGLTSSDQVRWLEELELEHDNLSEALLWLFEHAPAQATELACALWPFSYQRGYYDEARLWFEQALVGSDELPTPARIDALLKAGEVAFLQCDYGPAIDHLHSVLELIGSSGDPRVAAIARQRLGSIAREQGRYDESRRLHEQSMAAWESLGDRDGVASSLNYISFAAWLSRDFERAQTSGLQALAAFRSAGNLRDTSATLINLGTAATYRGELEPAAERLDEALSISRRLGFQEGVAWSLHELAILSRHRGRLAAEADVMLRDALVIHQQLGDRWRVASVLEEIAGSVRLRRDPSLAVRLLACAEALRERIGTPIPPAEAPARDVAVSRLRRQLSAGAYDAARREGRRLELREAVDLAVQALDDDVEAGAGLTRIVPILTPRELAVLELLTRGQTNREIAVALYISPSTAGVHVSNILRKLGAKRRVDAVALAHTMGLLPQADTPARAHQA